MNYLGDYPEDATIDIYFTTHASDTGSPIAPSSAFETADVKIYKNGSDSEKASTNGLTMTSPFDAIVGLHLLTIDTSNDTGDAGFWVAGGEYSVVLSPDETIDGNAALKVIASFSLERSSGPLALIQAGVSVGTGGIQSSSFAANSLDAAAVATDLGSELAAALLDLAAGVEDNRTVRQGLRLMLAALCGKLSGAATAEVSIRDTNDSKNRIVATVDQNGNRSAVVLDQD